MYCSNCGNEIKETDKFCNNCGSPVNNTQITMQNSTNELQTINSNPIQQNNSKLFRPTKTIGCLQVDSKNKLFKVIGRNATPFQQKKKHGLFSTAMAFSTMGMSRIAENVISSGLNSSKPRVYNFSDLNSFELLEDDSTITSGGVGRAIVGATIGSLGGPVTAGAAAITGGLTANRKTKKVIEMLSIKLNVNDFDNPCIFIPLITKSTKTNSSEYKVAYNKAQKIISMLDLITHNN